MSTRTRSSLPSEPGPAPGEAALREAALRHLARYAATESRLLAVLDRRIDRWLNAARKADPEDEAPSAQAVLARQAARRVVASLAAIRAVDDAAYAESRARSLLRSGRSRAMALRNLVGKGVAAETARAAVGEDDERDLDAAALLARKLRLGPFAATPADPAARQRQLGMFARAGFSGAVARKALAMSAAEAEQRIARLRRL